MFTGIITDLGHVDRLDEKPNGVVLTVACSYGDLSLGESVAVNGVCLTVTGFSTSQDHPEFFVSPETLRITNLSELKQGSIVNLERALRAQDRLSGHIVQGHIDGTGILTSIKEIPGTTTCYELTFTLSPTMSCYCVEKGSIALDGVSLTINRISGNEIVIMMIPHTWTHTRFNSLQPGARINVEIDILAKYVEKLCTRSQKS